MRLLSFFVMGHSAEPKALSAIRGALGFPGVWQLQSTLCWGGQSCGAGTLPCLAAPLHPAAKGLPAQALLRGLWTNRNKKQGRCWCGMASQLPTREAKSPCLYHACAGNLELDKDTFLQSWTEALVTPQLLTCTEIQLPQPPSFLGDRTVARLLCLFDLKQKQSGEKISKNYW